MINLKRFITNARELYSIPPLLEYSILDLQNMSDDARRARAKGITGIHYQRGVEQSKSGQVVTFWKVPSQSGNQPYRVTIEIHPKKQSLFKIVDDLITPKGTLIKNYRSVVNPVLFESDVLVHCTCKDFYWSGMKHNLGKDGKYGNSLAAGGESGEKNIAPDVRDPERQHVLCKHILSVRPVFRGNTIEIVSDIRKYNKEEGEGLVTPSKEEPPLEKMVKLEGEERDDFIEGIIGSEGVEDLERHEENVGSEDILDEEKEITQIEDEREETPPEEVEEIIEEENEEPLEEKENQAEDIIDQQNEIVQTDNQEPAPEVEEIIEEENIEPEEKMVLEKDKDKSNISSDPNKLLGR